MWIFVLLLLMGASAFSAIALVCACALSGRIDCDQEREVTWQGSKDSGLSSALPAQESPAVSGVQLLFN